MRHRIYFSVLKKNTAAAARSPTRAAPHSPPPTPSSGCAAACLHRLPPPKAPPMAGAPTTADLYLFDFVRLNLSVYGAPRPDLVAELIARYTSKSSGSDRGWSSVRGKRIEAPRAPSSRRSTTFAACAPTSPTTSASHTARCCTCSSRARRRRRRAWPQAAAPRDVAEGHRRRDLLLWRGRGRVLRPARAGPRLGGGGGLGLEVVAASARSLASRAHISGVEDRPERAAAWRRCEERPAASGRAVRARRREERDKAEKRSRCACVLCTVWKGVVRVGLRGACVACCEWCVVRGMLCVVCCV